MQNESAKYRAVLNTFWSDMDVVEWESDKKLFYLWSFTNIHLDICGCYQVSTKVIAHETGIEHGRVIELLAEFEAAEKIQYDHATKELLLLNWKKHNEGLFKATNGNSRKAIERGASQIKSLALQNVVLSWVGGGVAPTQAPTLTPTTQPKPKPEPEEEPKDDDASSQASTTPLPPTADTETSLSMSIFEFRAGFQEATGQLMPGGCNAKASELCRRYSREQIKGAFEVTATQGGRTFRYVEQVLDGKPRPEPRGRDRPSLVEERERILAANAAACRDFCEVQL